MNNNGSVYKDFEVKRMENEDLFIFTEVKLKWSVGMGIRWAVWDYCKCLLKELWEIAYKNKADWESIIVVHMGIREVK